MGINWGGGLLQAETAVRGSGGKLIQGNLFTEAEMAGYLLLKRVFWLCLSITSNFPSSEACWPGPALGDFPLHPQAGTMI